MAKTTQRNLPPPPSVKFTRAVEDDRVYDRIAAILLRIQARRDRQAAFS